MQRKLLGGIVAGGLVIVMMAAVISSAPPYGGGTARDEEGRYRVSAGGSSYVLYDSVTGVSWVFYPDQREKRPVLLPIRKLTTTGEVEVQRYLEENKDKK